MAFTSRGIGSRSFLENAGRSILYTVKDTVKKQLFPRTADLVEKNSASVQEAFRLVRDLRRVKDVLSSSIDPEVVRLTREAKRNFMQDLRSGNFAGVANQKRQDSAMARAMGMPDMDMDMGDMGMGDAFGGDMGGGDAYGEGSGDFFDDSGSGEAEAPTVVNKVRNVSVVNTVVQPVATGPTSDPGTHGRLNKIAGLSALGTQAMVGSIDRVAVGIAQMQEFNIQHVAEFHRVSAEYYTKSGQSLEKIAAGIELLAEDKMKQREAKSKVTTPESLNSFLDPGTGAIDIAAYGEYVRNNFKRKINDNRDMGMLMASQIAADPIGTAMSMLGGMLVPKKISEASEEIDKIVGGIAPTLLLRLRTYANENQGTITGMLADAMGLQTIGGKTKADMSKYEKGSVSFDGVTRKAIIEVIPSLLSRIYGAITKREGDDNLVYDYAAGQFTTAGAAKKAFETRLGSEAEYGLGKLSEGATDLTRKKYQDLMSLAKTPEEIAKVTEDMEKELVEVRKALAEFANRGIELRLPEEKGPGKSIDKVLRRGKFSRSTINTIMESTRSMSAGDRAQLASQIVNYQESLRNVFDQVEGNDYHVLRQASAFDSLKPNVQKENEEKHAQDFKKQKELDEISKIRNPMERMSRMAQLNGVNVGSGEGGANVKGIGGQAVDALSFIFKGILAALALPFAGIAAVLGFGGKGIAQAFSGGGSEAKVANLTESISEKMADKMVDQVEVEDGASASRKGRRRKRGKKKGGAAAAPAAELGDSLKSASEAIVGENGAREAKEVAKKGGLIGSVKKFGSFLYTLMTGREDKGTESRMSGSGDATGALKGGLGGVFNAITGFFFGREGKEGIQQMLGRVFKNAIVAPFSETMKVEWTKARVMWHADVVDKLDGVLVPFMEEFKYQVESLGKAVRSGITRLGGAFAALAEKMRNSVFIQKLEGVLTEKFIEPLRAVSDGLRKLMVSNLYRMFSMPIDTIKNMSERLFYRHLRLGRDYTKEFRERQEKRSQERLESLAKKDPALHAAVMSYKDAKASRDHLSVIERQAVEELEETKKTNFILGKLYDFFTLSPNLKKERKKAAKAQKMARRELAAAQAAEGSLSAASGAIASFSEGAEEEPAATGAAAPRAGDAMASVSEAAGTEPVGSGASPARGGKKKPRGQKKQRGKARKARKLAAAQAMASATEGAEEAVPAAAGAAVPGPSAAADLGAGVKSKAKAGGAFVSAAEGGKSEKVAAAEEKLNVADTYAEITERDYRRKIVARQQKFWDVLEKHTGLTAENTGKMFGVLSTIGDIISGFKKFFELAGKVAGAGGGFLGLLGGAAISVPMMQLGQLFQTLRQIFPFLNDGVKNAEKAAKLAEEAAAKARATAEAMAAKAARVTGKGKAAKYAERAEALSVAAARATKEAEAASAAAKAARAGTLIGNLETLGSKAVSGIQWAANVPGKILGSNFVSGEGGRLTRFAKWTGSKVGQLGTGFLEAARAHSNDKTLIGLFSSMASGTADNVAAAAAKAGQFGSMIQGFSPTGMIAEKAGQVGAAIKGAAIPAAAAAKYAEVAAKYGPMVAERMAQAGQLAANAGGLLSGAGAKAGQLAVNAGSAIGGAAAKAGQLAASAGGVLSKIPGVGAAAGMVGSIGKGALGAGKFLARGLGSAPLALTANVYNMASGFRDAAELLGKKEEDVTFLDRVAAAIGNGFDKLWIPFIGPIGDVVQKIFGLKMGDMTKAGASMFQDISDLFSGKVPGWMKYLFDSTVKKLDDAISSLPDFIEKPFRFVVDSALKATGGAFNLLNEWVLTPLVNRVSEGWSLIFQGAEEYLGPMFDKVVDKVSSWLYNLVEGDGFISSMRQITTDDILNAVGSGIRWGWEKLLGSVGIGVQAGEVGASFLPGQKQIVDSIKSLLEMLGMGGGWGIGGPAQDAIGKATKTQESGVTDVSKLPKAGALMLNSSADAAGTSRIPGAEWFAVPSGGSWRVTAPYGEMRGSKPHQGWDFGAPRGTSVASQTDGVVTYALGNAVEGDQRAGGGYGNTVFVRDSKGLYHIYGHLSKTMARAGQTVSRGQVIGTVGNTGHSFGPHLHYQVSTNENGVGGIDGRTYLMSGGISSSPAPLTAAAPGTAEPGATAASLEGGDASEFFMNALNSEALAMTAGMGSLGSMLSKIFSGAKEGASAAAGAAADLASGAVALTGPMASRIAQAVMANEASGENKYQIKHAIAASSNFTLGGHQFDLGQQRYNWEKLGLFSKAELDRLQAIGTKMNVKEGGRQEPTPDEKAFVKQMSARLSTSEARAKIDALDAAQAPKILGEVKDTLIQAGVKIAGPAPIAALVDAKNQGSIRGGVTVSGAKAAAGKDGVLSFEEARNWILSSGYSPKDINRRMGNISAAFRGEKTDPVDPAVLLSQTGGGWGVRSEARAASRTPHADLSALEEKTTAEAMRMAVAARASAPPKPAPPPRPGTGGPEPYMDREVLAVLKEIAANTASAAAHGERTARSTEAIARKPHGAPGNPGVAIGVVPPQAQEPGRPEMPALRKLSMGYSSGRA